VITGASVAGNFIIGALAVTIVKLSTPLAFPIGGTLFRAQPLLDSLLPNLLPLLLTLLLWWLLARKQVSPTLIMVLLIVAGILGAYPLWPGIDEITGEAIKVGLLR
jgi:mannose/fructose/N-acetylgalactosamine-specific phosphotransferase system component IID